MPRPEKNLHIYRPTILNDKPIVYVYKVDKIFNQERLTTQKMYSYKARSRKKESFYV